MYFDSFDNLTGFVQASSQHSNNVFPNLTSELKVLAVNCLKQGRNGASMC